MLEDMADMLEITGANPFKVRAFANAAREIEAQTGNIEDMVASGKLLEVHGIGKAIFGHIGEMLERGTFTDYEELSELMHAYASAYPEWVRIESIGSRLTARTRRRSWRTASRRFWPPGHPPRATGSRTR